MGALITSAIKSAIPEYLDKARKGLPGFVTDSITSVVAWLPKQEEQLVVKGTKLLDWLQKLLEKPSKKK